MTKEEAIEVMQRGDDVGVDVSIIGRSIAVFSDGWTNNYNVACNKIRAKASGRGEVR
jgi:hypothetical protein